MLLTGGYGLMTCWGSVFTVALCLQVAGPFGKAGEGVGAMPGALFCRAAVWVGSYREPGR